MQDLLIWLSNYFDFKILQGRPIRIEIKEIYGNIIIERTGNYNELWGQDDDDTHLYSGITFSTTPLVDSTREIHSLLLLKRDTFDTEFDWYVPDESRIRFEFESISPDLDGGEI